MLQAILSFTLFVVVFLYVDIELWSKEAPLACRNFIQLALEGYYDNTLVHRVVKGFMVQMGDPTGTGTGGYFNSRSTYLMT